jgi:putative membrane-bound dehydrogenase-like protein
MRRCLAWRSIAASFAAAAIVATAGCSRSGPPYSPQEALETFRLPPGFRIELAAAEPEVSDPVAFAFDERGRLFVVEMSDYPLSREARGRIKLLEDHDGDGRFERATVFADGLHFPHGVMPWKGGILVTCAPDILYFADRDGDGRAEVRQVLLTGFARVNPQLRVNAPTYGIDNWIYAAYPRFGAGRRFPEFSDFGQPIRFPDHPEVAPVDLFSKGMDLRFKPDQLKIEPVSGNSEFGLAFDAGGQRFPSWNDKHVQHVVIENRYLERNPYLPVGSAVQLASDHGDSAEVYPITENAILRDIRQPSVMGQLGHFTSACGQSVYTGDRLPPSYVGAYFIAEPVHNLVHCDRLTPTGATFRASRMLEKAEFLASRDSWFMPVFTATGPDGALYVADFYRKIVEHPEWIREDLANEEKLFYAGNDRGRIYRIVHQDSRPGPLPAMHHAGSRQLAAHLSDANGWRRITAQRLLVERGDRSVVPELQRLAAAASAAEGRMHALWTLEGLGSLTPEQVLQALVDPSPAVRRQALRLAEGRLADARISGKLSRMIDDPDGHVLFQLACTMSGLPAARTWGPLRELASRRVEDHWFQIAVLTSAKETARRWFTAFTHDADFLASRSDARSAFLRRITGILGARQEDAGIGDVIAASSGPPAGNTAWWRAAALTGLAEGLKRASVGRMRLAAAQQEQLLRLVESPAEPLRAAALELAGAIDLATTTQLRSVIERAEGAIKSRDADVPARVEAAKTLALDRSLSTLPALEDALTPQQPEEVQMAAARALLGMSDVRATEPLLKHWSAQTTAVRDVILAGFLQHAGRLNALLDAIEAGRIQPGSVSRASRQRILRVREEAVRKRAAALFAGVSSDRGPILRKYRAAAGANGNRERGIEVFRTHCSKCHKLGDIGQEVGPDLLTLAGQPKEELLANILDPNANIAPGYEEYLARTRDGKIVTGVIASQNATSVTLRRSKGEEDTILRGAIAEMRVLTASAMPENLEEAIDVQQMADLLEYLKSPDNTNRAGR